MNRGDLARVAAVAAAIGLAPSCRQVVGITGSAPEKLTSTVSGMPYGTTTCAACANDHCSGESAACAADTTCNAYESCLGACSGDPVCRSTCTIDHPVGTEATDVSALSACLAGSCEAACDLPCGGVAAYITEPANAAACQECITGGNACAPARAWGASVEGDAYWRCTLAAGADDVRQGCATDNDAGGDALQRLRGGLAGALREAVRVRKLLGLRRSPGLAAGSPRPCVVHRRRGGLRQHESRNAGPVRRGLCGLPVRRPHAAVPRGRRSSSGLLPFSFDNPVDAAGHGVNGCFQIASPDVVPMYVYWDYPLSVSAGVGEWNDPEQRRSGRSRPRSSARTRPARHHARRVARVRRRHRQGLPGLSGSRRRGHDRRRPDPGPAVVRRAESGGDGHGRDGRSSASTTSPSAIGC